MSSNYSLLTVQHGVWDNKYKYLVVVLDTSNYSKYASWDEVVLVLTFVLTK
jgi:hypothetical protein